MTIPAPAPVTRGAGTSAATSAAYSVASRLRPSPAPARRVGPLRRLTAAAVSGLVLVLAFPPIGIWPLAPVAVAVIVLACRGAHARAAFGLGLVAGLAFFLPLLHWTSNVGADAWILLATSQAVAIGGLGVGLTLVTRLPGWPVWSAAAWVAQEAVRDRVPFGGFPWGRLAFSQGGTPFTGYAAWGGAPLVTFAVALGGGLLAWAVAGLARRPRRRGATAGGATATLGIVAVATVGIVAVAIVGILAPGPVPTTGTATVALIQGNVPRLGLEFNAQRAAVLDNHVAATEQLGAAVRAGSQPRPDLVIWPENSSDLDPLTDAQATGAVDAAVRAVGVPVLVGAVLQGPGRFIRNAGIVWDPVTGPGPSYVKRHPVPFAEYVPFRPILTALVGRFAMVPNDFLAGSHPGVLTVGPVRLGDVICFEVAYDDLVRDVVTGGGQLLVVQTNNATFGRSGETTQQLAMSQVRAVEHGRTVLVAATSGISAVIGPDGRVIERSAVFTPDTLLRRVPLAVARTPADRVGAAPELLLTAIALVAAGAGGWVGRHPRG